MSSLTPRTFEKILREKLDERFSKWEEEFTKRLRAELTSGDPAVKRLLSKDILPTKDVAVHLSDALIGAGKTESVDVGPIMDRSGFLLTVKASYHTAATKGVRVRFLFSPDGANYDTPEDADAEGNYMEPTFAAGAVRQKSVIVAYASPYVKLSVTNLDAIYPVVVSLWTSRVK